MQSIWKRAAAIAVAIALPWPSYAASLQCAIARDGSGNTLINQVTVSANFGSEGAGEDVTLVIYDQMAGETISDADIVFLWQAVAGESGKANFFWQTTRGGDFLASVRLGGSQQLLQTAIPLMDMQAFEEVLSQFRTAATPEKMAALISEQAASIGYDIQYFAEMSDDAKQTAAKAIIAQADQLSVQNLEDSINQAIILTYLPWQTNYERTRAILHDYEERYFHLGGQAEAIHMLDSYYQLPVPVQDAVLSALAKQKPLDFDAYRAAFYETTLLTGLRMLDKAALDALLLENLDYAGLNGYDSLSPSEKNRILSALMANTSITALSQLRSAYLALRQTDTKPADKHGGTSGSSARKSSSGGYAVDSSAIQTPSAPIPEKKRNSFSDVDAGHWANAAISSLTERGIISGRGDGVFEPESLVTRAEFLKLLVSAFDLLDTTASCAFSDATLDDWYYPYVASAFQQGICMGYPDGSCGASQTLTREEMATLTYRLLLSQRLTVTTQADELSYTDAALISEYAKNSVAMMSALAMIRGLGDGRFGPQQPATRAQAAQLVYQILNR